MHAPVYLDHNASAPLAPEVVEAVARALADLFGNASSIHSYGQRAKAALDDARTEVARLIAAEPGDIVFTRERNRGRQPRPSRRRGRGSGRRARGSSSRRSSTRRSSTPRRRWADAERPSPILPVDADGRRAAFRLRGRAGRATWRWRRSSWRTTRPASSSRSRSSRGRPGREGWWFTPTRFRPSARSRSTSRRSASTCSRCRRTSSEGRRGRARCGFVEARPWRGS